jgi:MULE transposase domain
MEPSIRSEVCYFKCAVWAWGPCIEAFRYLRSVISIDAAFLSRRYERRLLMACGYDVENQLIPMAFALFEKENLDNWGWFMSWLRREVIGPGRICVISDQHKAIKAVFEYS